MADAHAADQREDRLRVEDVPDHPVTLHLVEPSLGATGHDTTRILSTVLQQTESLVQLRTSRGLGRVVRQKQSDNTACRSSNGMDQQLETSRKEMLGVERKTKVLTHGSSEITGVPSVDSTSSTLL